MYKYYSNIILLFLSLSTLINCTAQSLTDTVYKPEIHTIQLYKDGWELSHPVINLNTDDKLKLSFDELGTEYKNYWFTIIHCNSNWEPSNISYSEISNGFEINQITDHAFSTNTLVNYVHYSLVFPNENCMPIISGNYILKVFENQDTSKTAFQKKFYVTENAAYIDIKVERPDVPKYMMKCHQLRVKADVQVDNYSDLRTEIKTRVLQNFNPYTSKDIFLSHLEGTSLYYDDPDSNIFEGGNEFRNFDIKSKIYQSAHLQSITYNNTLYDIVLYPDEWRNKKQYYTDNDLNGNYYIANTIGVNKDIDADYQMIYFNLPTPEPILDGQIFILGELTDWKCNTYSKMNYNFRTKAYEANLLLKQGYYNYMYVYKSLETNTVDLSYVEGKHYETDDEYTVFVYYKPSTSRYERLIGYTIGNSIKK